MTDDSIAELFDPSCDYPNLRGEYCFPWMHPKNVTDEQAVFIHDIWQRWYAARHLSQYARYTLDVDPARHHMVICNHIDRLFNDEWDDLVICTPPGAAKSTYTSHASSSWFMGRYPKKSMILATHTADLSEKWSRKVRNTLADERHRHVFPGCFLSSDSTAVGRWATSSGGEFLAVGVGASILGFRADVAVIDDPISGFEQAQSDTQLQKVQGWFETDLITRLKPGGKIILICQRLSANDLAGYLIARNAENPTRRLKVLTLRMEYEEGDEDGTGRKPGDRLWPEWFTPEMIEDNKRDQYRWQTLYQQRPPSSSGDWIGPDHIQIVDDVPNELSRYLLTDLALSVNKGDYSVHLTVGVGSDGMVYVEDAWRKRAAVEETVERHIDICQSARIMESLIDDDNAAKVYVQLLADRARARGVNVPWKTLPMRGQDKETRAAPLRGMFRSGRVRLKRGSWNEWLVRELLIFPNALGNGVDDGVDALGLIGRRLASLSRPAGAPPVEKKTDPRGSFYEATLNDLWESREMRGNRGIRI